MSEKSRGLAGYLAILAALVIIPSFLICRYTEWAVPFCWLRPCPECPAPEECSDCEGDEAAFTLVIEQAEFGTFMPLNNRFPCPDPDPDDGVPPPEECRPHQSGFFAQLADFKDTLHSFNRVEIFHSSDSIEAAAPDDVVARSEFRWIDVRCNEGFGEALSFEDAARLLPLSITSTHFLHKDIKAFAELDPAVLTQIKLVTIWQGEQGLTASTLLPDALEPYFAVLPASDHAHDLFVFRSPTPCEVRIWDDVAAGAQNVAGTPTTQIHTMVVREDWGAAHGGVHHPPWN